MNVGACNLAQRSSRSNEVDLEVDLHQVLYALSEALDLVGIDDIAHGKRVAVMAADCARAMGRSESEAALLFELGMLHDIGASSTTTRHHLIRQFEWDGAQEHCTLGHDRLCAPPSGPPVRRRSASPHALGAALTAH